MLPLFYYMGLSSGDFDPELRESSGAEAVLSASTVTRLTKLVGGVPVHDGRVDAVLGRARA